MKPYGQLAEERRVANTQALAVFGISPDKVGVDAHLRIMREGRAVTIFTIGYEGRTGSELVSLLSDVGIDLLADVREKPISRKADFRSPALKARCEEIGIDYQLTPELGSTKKQRDALRETGDIKAFSRRFRSYAQRNLAQPLDRLAELAKHNTIALLCYERRHDDCHRKIVADLVADRLDASVVAIV